MNVGRGWATLQTSKKPNLQRLARECNRVHLQGLLGDPRTASYPGLCGQGGCLWLVKSPQGLSSLQPLPGPCIFAAKFPDTNPNHARRGVRDGGGSHTAARLGARVVAAQSGGGGCGVAGWLGVE